MFNGDTGIIDDINNYNQSVTVKFEDGRYVDYEFTQLDELELAYAITVHKAQGSEYPAVIIPMYQGPRMLMNRNILYTAVTRARKCVCMIGDEQFVIRNRAGLEQPNTKYKITTEDGKTITGVTDAEGKTQKVTMLSMGKAVLEILDN